MANEEKRVEQWKLVEGTEDYWVSDFGRLKKGRKLKKLHKNPEGYMMCYIERKKCKLHRLVATAFVDNPDPVNKNVVDHIDGDKTNNNATNLRWVTIRENVQAAFENNLIDLKGTYFCLAIDKDNNMTLYKTQAIAAKELNIYPKSVSQAARGIKKQANGYRFLRVKSFTDKRDIT